MLNKAMRNNSPTQKSGLNLCSTKIKKQKKIKIKKVK